MNINIKSNCYDLNINMPVCPCDPAEPSTGNSDTLFPGNPDNKYDGIGEAHNESILYSYSQMKSDDSEEQILKYIDDFLSKDYPLPDVPKTWDNQVKIGPHDLDTIFYPPIPDFDLNGDWLRLRGSVGGFNAERDSYNSFKSKVVAFETALMRVKMKESYRAKYLIATSVMRHSLALWLGIGQEIDPGVIYALGPITEADVNAVDDVNPNWSINRQTRFVARASRRAARALRRN